MMPNLIDHARTHAGAMMRDIRHHLHRHPELAYEEVQTSELIAEKLAELGIDVKRGIAGTGLVGTLRRGEGPRLGLRADMDALPVHEHDGPAHGSTKPGVMHACGHDGHVAMLLGAVALLVKDDSWRGTIHFIFQPAEECGGGGKAMIEDGLLELFPCDAIYALHNWPGLAAGEIAVQPGPMMAALDTFEIDVQGKGTHAAMPEKGRDPIVAATQLVAAFQTIVSRLVSPSDPLVVSVTQIHAGDAFNVIPDSAVLRGTVRCFSATIRDEAEAAMQAMCEGVSLLSGCKIALRYMRGYPPTINSAAEAEVVARAADALLGEGRVHRTLTPSMASEDFSFMLEACPGAYAWLGAGEAALPLHNPGYDFNDDLLATGAAYWLKLAQDVLAPR